MENVFVNEICSVCKRNNTNECNKLIIKEKNNNYDRTFCTEYQKDKSKIQPYIAPIFVTAKRDYINLYEV